MAAFRDGLWGERSAHSVLVVEPDDEERLRIFHWLEGLGYDLMFCPGPSEPDYICVGSHGGDCPLADVADVVVLDLRLRSDQASWGTRGWELFLHYYERGRRIVVISGEDDPVRPLPDERVWVLPRPPERDAFVAALQAAATRPVAPRAP